MVSCGSGFADPGSGRVASESAADYNQHAATRTGQGTAASAGADKVDTGKSKEAQEEPKERLIGCSQEPQTGPTPAVLR